MTVQGAQAKLDQECGPKEVAQLTVRTMLRSVPAAVPGIVFLSGGLSEEAASAYLNEMNNITTTPWTLSFSYGRALQHSCLKEWGGTNIDAGQKALYARAQAKLRSF